MQIVCANCFALNRIPESKNYLDALCGRCKRPINDKKPVTLNDDNFYRFVEKNDLPIIVDFWASWCGPCQNMAPVFESVSQQSDGLLFAKLNTEDSQYISADAGIRSLPTLVFFHKGQEIDRISGGLSESHMKSWIMQCVQKLA